MGLLTSTIGVCPKPSLVPSPIGSGPDSHLRSRRFRYGSWTASVPAIGCPVDQETLFSLLTTGWRKRLPIRVTPALR